MPTRDWSVATPPGVDVAQVHLENDAFEGRNAVYVLGHGGDARTTLVDTGVATPAVRASLERGLDEIGVKLADVDQVLLTHWHTDHAGLAGAIQAAGGATVRVHEADAPLVERDPEATAAVREDRRSTFEEWGMPAGAREELLAFLDGESEVRGVAPEVEPFGQGATFAVGDVTLEAVHLPGHAAGLTAFVTADGGSPEAFVGDAILPKYTPNVGGADLRVDRPLARYVRSLDRIATAGWERAWPGHRGVIVDPAGRAREILAHHRERTRRVLDVVRECGPVDAWAVSAALFGDLSAIHILHGPGEADAHLSHLADEGVLAVRDAEYAVRDDAPERVRDALPGGPGVEDAVAPDGAG